MNDKYKKSISAGFIAGAGSFLLFTLLFPLGVISCVIVKRRFSRTECDKHSAEDRRVLRKFLFLKSWDWLAPLRQTSVRTRRDR